MKKKLISLWSSVYWILGCGLMGGLLGLAVFVVVSHPASPISEQNTTIFALPYALSGLVLGLVAYQGYFLWYLQKFGNWLTEHNQELPPNFPRQFQTNLSVIAQKVYHANQQQQLAHQQTLSLLHKIRSSLAVLQDAVILIDSNDCLECWNHAAQSMLNLSQADRGRHILTLIRTPNFHEFYQKPEHYHEGIRLNAWQNNGRFVQCEITPFGQEKLMVIYDVTRVQHLEQMRKDFVANVSHELRTPLTVIMGYVETLSEQPDLDPRWQRAYKQMMQQSQRMNNIINDLLLLSRLENDEKPAEMVDIDMPRLLTQLFDEAQIYNKSHEHLIHLHIDSQKHILGYEKYLTSALSNLITNAIKYTHTAEEKTGEISLNWYEKEGGVCFSVTDNGIGIEPRHIERLTERFYRVDSGRSRETGGTGLGLAIVKHVLYQHGATLNITSKVGEGSAFTVFFPKERVI